MRALLLDPAGQMFGSERVLLDFLKAARASRWAITVCTPKGPLADRLRQVGVEVDDSFLAGLHHRGRFARARAALALLRCALRVRPQLIDVNQAGATRIALLVGRLLAVPVVSHVRLVEDVAYMNRLGASQRSLPAIICVSDFVRGLFVGLGERCHRVYDPFAPRANQLSSLTLTSGDLRIVCVGRIVRDKAQMLLLDALETLRARGLKAHLVFVGPANDLTYHAELLQRIGQRDLAGDVEFVGERDDVYPYLRAAHLLVCPSRCETLGRVVFEAWDAGVLPIGYTGSGGLAEVLAASGAGIAFDRWDGESLADAIERAAALSPSERATLIERGRAWSQRELSPAACSEQVLRIWDEVAR